MKMHPGDTVGDRGEFIPGDLPVDSFREAAPRLRRPFAPNAIRWRVVTGSMLVAYVDARSVIERLNLVVPHLWSAEYQPWGERVDSGLLVCHLTIDGLTRSDVGKNSSQEPVKGAYSDALKRAAVHFGVGVSLYAMKRTYMKVGDGNPLSDGTPTLKKKTNAKGKEVNELTASGEKWLREKYGEWLTTDRGKHFGEALDHGDDADSVGDVEVDAAPQDEQTSLEVAAKRAEVEAAYKAKTNGKASHPKLPKAKLKALLDNAKTVEELERVAESVEALA